MEIREARRALVEYGASLFRRRFTVGTSGNMSVRTSEGFLMTPTNTSFGSLEEESLSLLGEDWVHLGGKAPSKEVFMHRAVYEGNPEAEAVVHLHSTFVTAFSCLAVDEEFPLLTPYQVMRMGERVPRIQYFRPGTDAMVDEIRSAATHARAMILNNHGSLVSGRDLHDAVASAEELEASAELALLLHGRDTRALSPAEVTELLS